jgi:hypothetical protein
MYLFSFDVTDMVLFWSIQIMCSQRKPELLILLRYFMLVITEEPPLALTKEAIYKLSAVPGFSAGHV